MKYVCKTKVCKICGKRKQLATEFYKSKGSYCKECCITIMSLPENKEKKRQYRIANKAKVSKYYKTWYFVNGRKRKSKEVIEDVESVPVIQDDSIW